MCAWDPASRCETLGSALQPHAAPSSRLGEGDLENGQRVQSGAGESLPEPAGTQR